MGSSEVAAVLGLSPYETPYEVWARKKGPEPPKETNTAMRLGNILEDGVAQLFQEESGTLILEEARGNVLYVDEERDWLRASPDRLFAGQGGLKSVLECKTTTLPVDEDNIPKYWFCQLQYQLGVMGVEKGAIAWLQGGRHFGYKFYDFNKDFFEWMAGEVSKFWLENVLGNIAPDAQTASDLAKRFPTHLEGVYNEASDQTYLDYLKLKELKEKASALSTEIETLEFVLKNDIQSAEGLRFGDKVLATWKAAKPSEKVDLKRLEAENKSLVARYKVTSEGARRFLIK